MRFDDVLASIGRLLADAEVLDVALQKHVRATAGQHELHSYLHRLQVIVADLRRVLNEIPAPSALGLG